mmetsp:Transcript_22150/g.68992  ORF Transcript_22150/g.68992 Transcript_22150/m.68992 type:complete len:113 (-) Transcript_22150:126-464(-)
MSTTVLLKPLPAWAQQGQLHMPVLASLAEAPAVAGKFRSLGRPGASIPGGLRAPASALGSGVWAPRAAAATLLVLALAAAVASLLLPLRHLSAPRAWTLLETEAEEGCSASE